MGKTGIAQSDPPNPAIRVGAEALDDLPDGIAAAVKIPNCFPEGQEVVSFST